MWLTQRAGSPSLNGGGAAGADSGHFCPLSVADPSLWAAVWIAADRLCQSGPTRGWVFSLTSARYRCSSQVGLQPMTDRRQTDSVHIVCTTWLRRRDATSCRQWRLRRLVYPRLS